MRNRRPNGSQQIIRSKTKQWSETRNFVWTDGHTVWTGRLGPNSNSSRNHSCTNFSQPNKSSSYPEICIHKRQENNTNKWEINKGSLTNSWEHGFNHLANTHRISIKHKNMCYPCLKHVENKKKPLPLTRAWAPKSSLTQNPSPPLPKPIEIGSPAQS